MPLSKTVVIHNGYDPGDFPRAAHNHFPKFTIAHAGSFYGGNRDPTAFFQALRALADHEQIDLAAVQVNLYGHFESAVDRIARQNNLEGIVAWRGYIPYHDLVSDLVNNYCLLLLTHQTDLTVPSKLFDYIGCRRPTIALSPPNATLERIVRETGIGRVVNPSDALGIADALLECWTRWRSHDPAWIECDHASAQVYTRQYQTELLARLLDRATLATGEGTRVRAC